ncbi:MAG TPA: hypothetical protein PLX23_11245 [Candidatus Hydrogenedens sp.]|nr:hypothetical protein [Candidatus Hydrogenedens sp.]
MGNFYTKKFLLFSAIFFISINTVGEKIYFIAPDAGIVKEVLPEKLQKDTWYPAGITPQTFTTYYITYNIAYCDPAGTGFNDPNHPNRKSCLETVLKYISNVLRKSGTIDILVEQSETDGNDALAYAGSYIFENKDTFSPCFSQSRLLTGTKPNVTTPEIELTVDFGRDYYEDPTNTSPAYNQVDLVSVLLHEFTHGFGFLSFVEESGYTQISTNGYYLYTTFDQFIYKSNLALFSGSPPSFYGTSSDTTCNQLVFKSTYIEALFGNGGLAIYSKNPFLDGTSLNHWDPERTGISNAVMNPSFMAGKVIRYYSTADLCALKSIGYTNIQLSISEGNSEGTTEGEGISEEGQIYEGLTEGEGSNNGHEGQIREGEGIYEGQIEDNLDGNLDGESSIDGEEENQTDACGCLNSKDMPSFDRFMKYLLDFLLLGLLVALLAATNSNNREN